MAQVQLREDPMSRIQREIIEVTEREREFREGHIRQNGAFSPDCDEKPSFLSQATSTPSQMSITSSEIHKPSKTYVIQNGYVYRTSSQPSTKGLMQRFISNKGKLNSTPTGVPFAFYNNQLLSPVHSPSAITVPLQTQTIKKRRQPVKEKIANELKEMRDREYELKRMRKKRELFDFTSDFSSDSELEDDYIVTGSLKPAKSIGEVYSDSLSSSQESGASPKPAKSLAELCELPPGQEFIPVSSISLIAKFESLIKQNND